jgi:hypothetical protein
LLEVIDDAFSLLLANKGFELSNRRYGDSLETAEIAQQPP